MYITMIKIHVMLEQRIVDFDVHLSIFYLSN